MFRDRITRLLWWVALLALAGVWLITLTLGWDDFTGNAAFALLVSAILADVAVLCSVFLGSRDRRLAAGAWWAVAIVCLGLSVLIASNPDAEATQFGGLVLLYVMLSLSFPLGVIVAPVANALFQPIQSLAGAPAAIVVAWVMFVLLGYVQWFRVIPHFLQKLFARSREVS